MISDYWKRCARLLLRSWWGRLPSTLCEAAVEVSSVSRSTAITVSGITGLRFDLAVFRTLNHLVQNMLSMQSLESYTHTFINFFGSKRHIALYVIGM